MSIKHIVTYVDNDSGCAARLKLAAQLAGAHEALLTGIFIKRQFVIPAYAGVHIPAEVLEENERISDELAVEAEQTFRASLADTAVACEWHVLEGRLPDAASRLARCADLLVLAQFDPADDGVNDNYSPDSLLLDAGTPALMVPFAGEFAAPVRHALVAWDGGREAARAVRDALPLLARVAQVTVFNVQDGHGAPVDGEYIVAQLRRHGLEVAFEQSPRTDLAAGDRMLEAVADLKCDLLVMGAYGHSRLRETVLGGVTRHLLHHMTVPVLMSH